MRNFPPRLLRNVILFAVFIVPLCVRGNDLDTMLALPPSASITREDAVRRVETLRSFIPDHPDRADEIEAYLIPFMRVMEPLSEVTPTPPPIRPVAKPMVLIKSSDGTWSLIRATSRRRQGAVIMLVDEKGARAVLQASFVVGELPWYSETELEGGGVNLKDLAGRYETFARVFPGVRKVLKLEIDRLREMQEVRDRATAEKEKVIQDRLTKVTSAAYEPAAGYQAATLARLLLEAEKVRNELPQFAENIDTWAAPFRAHFAKLLSGYSYADGAWVSSVELARRAREKRQQEFLRGLDYRIGSVAGPAEIVEQMATPLLMKAGVMVVAGLGLLIFGRRRPYLLPAGVVLLALAPLGMVTAFFLATRNPVPLPTSAGVDAEQSVVDVLSQAAGLNDARTNISWKVTEEALNRFIARRVRIVPEGVDANATPVRRSMAVRLLPGRIAIFEMVRFLELDWIVRLDVDCRKEDERMLVVLTGAKIGALRCPAAIAEAWWKNLQPQFAAILVSNGVAEHFTFQPPVAGAIELKPATTEPL